MNNRVLKDYLTGIFGLITAGASLFLIALLINNTEIGKTLAELFCIVGIGVAVMIFIGTFKQD
jgi:hypothetical protein